MLASFREVVGAVDPTNMVRSAQQLARLIGEPQSSLRRLLHRALAFRMQHQELIRHVFVLMLENRSFDHIFGYSSITGTDSATDAPTEVEGLTHGAGTNVNPNTGGTLSTSPTAPFSLAGVASDVEHEFLDVLTQLCGPNALPHGSVVLPSGVYPQVNNSGFVADFVAKPHGSRRTARRRQGPASGHKLMRARRVTFREQNWVRSFER